MTSFYNPRRRPMRILTRFSENLAAASLLVLFHRSNAIRATGVRVSKCSRKQAHSLRRHAAPGPRPRYSVGTLKESYRLCKSCTGFLTNISTALYAATGATGARSFHCRCASSSRPSSARAMARLARMSFSSRPGPVRLATARSKRLGSAVESARV